MKFDLSKTFLVRLVEQVGVIALLAFVGSFASSLEEVHGSVTKAALVAAVTTAIAAAGRAIYGVLASRVGDPEVPSVK
jgi:drug/metabolite transporter (DMT)-like permease